ncbi:FAD-dependent oxidoreductase, partial [Nocardia abscessus]|uniref:FAD-dependent oxidoreductase n=1 Tax=Nocardia abscessus TaxID=120957 RepID=UPI002455BF9E
MAEEKQVDVVVIGGGAAGLSAALTLARARRTVVVVDAREPRNAPAAGVHGWLTRDGIPPAALVTIGAREVEQYGGRIRYARAMAARRTPDGFVVDTDRGGAVEGGAAEIRHRRGEAKHTKGTRRGTLGPGRVGSGNRVPTSR